MDSIILIPAYKPEAQMTDLVAALAQKNLTVVVVDDGSGAPYRDRFAEVEAHARLVTCEQNGGKGEALRVGLRYIREHFSPPYSVVTADADGQHRVKDILRVARVARRHPESLVLGCRTVSREMPLRNWFGNFYTKIAFFLATGRFFRDTQTGLRGFSDRMIPYLLGIRGNRYEYETNALLWWGRCGQPILEVPIRTVYLDGNSTSHFKAVRDSVRIYAKIQNMTVPDAINKVTKGQPVKVKTKDHDIFIQYKKSAGKRKLVLSSKVMDSRSHTNILDATVQLLTTDSIVIDQKKAGRTFMVLDRTYSNSEFNFEVPKAVANYIIRVSHVNYETAYLNISLSKIGKWEVQRDLPPVYLKEKRHVLKEINVVASKVMFYYRGDTIVYNADAFQLAEGSMLDALVKQLPGVELKEGGRIYHNGKFVQNLLLNGKDFFRGHQELMLENLPSYTVKEIKVYDKYGRQSELSGEQLPFDKEYVMDVQLKREYSIGWLANADAGAGTNNRYMGRLFALRHTDHSRIAIIGNVNNLNDEERPGETKTWKAPVGTVNGRKAQKMVGVDYDIEERDKIWKLLGHAELTYTDLDQRDKTERTNYLTTGDTYDHSQS